MKKGILAVIYIVIAVGVIIWGTWYSGMLTGQTADNADTGGTMSQSTSTQMAATSTQSGAASTTASTKNTNMDTLQIIDLTVGTGTAAENGDTVTVNYIGTLDNGTKFDSSYDRNQPFSFVLGKQQVIQGWDEGVLGMKVGGKRELVIPPSLGYGAGGAGGGLIPPNATLHFTIELLSVSK